MTNALPKDEIDRLIVTSSFLVVMRENKHRSKKVTFGLEKIYV